MFYWFRYIVAFALSGWVINEFTFLGVPIVLLTIVGGYTATLGSHALSHGIWGCFAGIVGVSLNLYYQDNFHPYVVLALAGMMAVPVVVIFTLCKKMCDWSISRAQSRTVA